MRTRLLIPILVSLALLGAVGCSVEINGSDDETPVRSAPETEETAETADEPATDEEESFIEIEPEEACARIAERAVEISEEQSNGFAPLLLKVRNPKATKDNRSTFELPTGDKEALALRCRGTGVWSDNSKTPVSIESTVDSDGTDYVAFEPIE